MSIKFKQNGQWVKIPTPSQIDDSAASAATTYSSNKINEIIPQDIAKYLLEHKDELGTDDFTKLKNVPFTTINTTNKSEFTTLKGILDHPDGMYLVDDCGVTNGDEQLTIASFKGHCSTMLMASIAQFKEIVDSDEIRCYKGSVIYILTEGNISNGATRYVTICNVPMGVSGGSVAPDRATSDAGTSVVNIEIHAVEDRSSGTVIYSYDIDGGTQTLFTQPQYVSMLTPYTNALVSGGIITGKSSYSPNQLVKVVEDADCQLGYRFTGVDISEFKSPLTLITNKNATNYNTLDKLCHLDDGLYLCKDTYKTNQDYIVDITFNGIDLADTIAYSFTGTEPTPDAHGNTKCKNGAIISVVTQEGNTKNKIVRITHGLNADTSGNGQGFYDIYIIAEPDDSSTASTLVYGVTGENVRYYRPFSVNTIYGSVLPFIAMNQTLFDGANANGKMAVWNKSESAQMPTLGFADIPTSPIIEVNDSNWSKFDTLQKWFEAKPGVYYINLSQTSALYRPSKYISGVFTHYDIASNVATQTSDTSKIWVNHSLVQITEVPSGGSDGVYETHLFFHQIMGYTGLGVNGLESFVDFVHSSTKDYSVTSVSCYDYGYNVRDVINTYFKMFVQMGATSISSSDIGKYIKVGSPSSSDYGNEYEFQAVDITLIGNSTAITPAQVLAAVNEGKTTTITHTDATHGTFKFTSFGVVSTASGDTVSSSITYGTGADSLTLYTLIGDVTNGTWALYSKSLTVSA